MSGISLVIGESRSTFYLLPSPSSFTIFNEYEQSLSPEELAHFVPYTPLQLMAADVLLGDGISHAAKFRFGNEIFFLLRDASGHFVGEVRKNEPLVISNCETLDDTVEVMKDGVLAVAPLSSPVRTIARGKLLARIFRCDGRCYVLVMDASACFGWSSLEPGGAWRRIGVAPSRTPVVPSPDTLLPEDLQERICEKVAEFNERIRRFFSHFDTCTGTEQICPQWVCECTARQCRCTLTPPFGKGDELPESTREFRHEIENMLLIGRRSIMTGGMGEIVVTLERRQ